MSYTDTDGAQAIIDLQALVGVTESRKKAAAAWTSMSHSDRESTELAHQMMCKTLSKRHAQPLARAMRDAVGGKARLRKPRKKSKK